MTAQDTKCKISFSERQAAERHRADPLLFLLMLEYYQAIKSTFTIMYHVSSRMSHRFVLQAKHTDCSLSINNK